MDEDEGKDRVTSLLMKADYEDFIEEYEDYLKDIETDENRVKKKKMYKLEIDARKIDKVKKERTMMSNEEKFKYMLTQEYDYKKINPENPLLEISLKTTIKIRPYQEKALSRMFVGGR